MLIIIGCLTTTLSLFFALPSTLLNAATVPIITLLFGLAALGWNGCFHAVIPGLSGVDGVGMATGVSLAVLYVSAMSAVPLFGFIVDWTGSYGVAWAASAVVSLVGVLLLALIREEHRPRVITRDRNAN